jgi:hypothetical protein
VRIRSNDRSVGGTEPKQTSAPPEPASSARRPPGVSSPQELLALQGAAGNAVVVQALHYQGHPGAAAQDHGEHRHSAGQGAPQPAVQRSAVHNVLRAPGRPLGADVRADMEARFGADFSDVRVHDDGAARESAAELGARAYTSGSHIVIGEGGRDKHTLAHELTHVIQQRQGQVAGTDNGNGLKVSDPSDRFEKAAEATAHRVMAAPARADQVGRAGQPPAAQRSTGGEAVQLKTATKPKPAEKPPVTGQPSTAKDPGTYGPLGDGTVGNVTNIATLDEAGRDTENTIATKGGTNAGFSFSIATSLAGLGVQLNSLYHAHKGRKEAEKGTAGEHLLKRDEYAAFGGANEQGFTFAQASLGLTGAVMKTLGTASEIVEKGVGLAAGSVGIIPAAIQFLRHSRKAVRAGMRARRIEALLNDENMPAKQAMNKAKAVVPTVQENVRLAQEVLDKAQGDLKDAAGSQDEEKIAACAAAVKAAESALAGTRLALENAKKEEREKREAFERVKAAVVEKSQEVIRYGGEKSKDGGERTKGGRHPISLLEIQQYAAEKNWRGMKRKALTAVSGALGVSGSVFAIVAVATTGAIASNPVGWGIAAAAALAALSVVAWKGYRKFKHRYHQTAPGEGETGSRRQRFKRTFQFWKPAAPNAANERQEMAGALYRMASDESKPELCSEARRFIETLGLTWKEMASQPEKGTDLIAAKFASG